MHDFPPNINWRYTTLLATVIGYLLSADYTVREQVAIGNWIIQIGQTVLTNSTYQELIEARVMGEENINLNGREFKNGGSPFICPSPDYNFRELYEVFKTNITDEELKNLSEAINKINEELTKMREEFKK